MTPTTTTMKPRAGGEQGSLCYVSARDYARYWGQEIAFPIVPTESATRLTQGLDRRHPGDRRSATAHDRRWDAGRGRRIRERRHRHRQIALPFGSA